MLSFSGPVVAFPPYVGYCCLFTCPLEESEHWQEQGEIAGGLHFPCPLFLCIGFNGEWAYIKKVSHLHQSQSKTFCCLQLRIRWLPHIYRSWTLWPLSLTSTPAMRHYPSLHLNAVSFGERYISQPTWHTQLGPQACCHHFVPPSFCHLRQLLQFA